jgi:hypothetical protein
MRRDNCTPCLQTGVDVTVPDRCPLHGYVSTDCTLDHSNLQNVQSLMTCNLGHQEAFCTQQFMLSKDINARQKSDPIINIRHTFRYQS